MAKILLVEDNEMNRDMLSRRLQRQGHEVSIAVNGKDALAIVNDIQPELILMDLSLPEIDGWGRESILEWIAISVFTETLIPLLGFRESSLTSRCF